MKNTTCAAIQNDGTITKWWLVVHGEESLLADLDNQWDTITTQLGWKLQPTYSFDESVPTLQQEAADNLDMYYHRYNTQ